MKYKQFGDGSGIGMRYMYTTNITNRNINKKSQTTTTTKTKEYRTNTHIRLITSNDDLLALASDCVCARIQVYVCRLISSNLFSVESAHTNTHTFQPFKLADK